jgi:hypothetical protein
LPMKSEKGIRTASKPRNNQSSKVSSSKLVARSLLLRSSTSFSPIPGSAHASPAACPAH